ncbi:MAG: hypothetical protein M3O26_00580 [Pseudomonadota bacterium]|nr:hypothetical protein [Pseudomonadota bacterium]
MNTMRAIGPCILSDRRNTNRATIDAIAGMMSTAGRKMTMGVIMTTVSTTTGTGKIITIMDKNATTTTDMPHSSIRAFVVGLLVAVIVLAAPLRFAGAAGASPSTAVKSAHDSSFATTLKRDAKTVGVAFKEGAHRVAIASKAVAHEVATAAKRGAAETRAAFRGEKSSAPAS